ncbi:MAG: hypothetical protein AAF004_01055, partial [Pseudomonadota bacterium]
VSGVFYGRAVADMSMALGNLAPPTLPLLIKYTIILIVFAVVGHIIVALARPSEADDMVDERDRVVIDKAGHWSGYILGFGVISGLFMYMFSYSGSVLFYTVFGSLMLAQFAEYVFQIVLYRWSV